jgi:hypothetical protein
VNREQLAHVLRAAATLEGPDILVIGSQAILGSYDEALLPLDATLSIEADLAFRSDPDETKSDNIDGMIGEGSAFHEAHAYYAQGVSISTAVLPAGWQQRLIPFIREDAYPSRALCLEPHDLVISKLVAGREKDYTFTTALLRANLIRTTTLHERAQLIERPGAVVKRVQESIDRCDHRSKR